MFRRTGRRNSLRRAAGPPAVTSLRRAVAGTRLSIGAERLARCFWPFWAFSLAAAAFVLFDGLSWLPVRGVLPVLGAMALAGVVLAVAGMRKFTWPTFDDAAARLDSALPGRPIEALTDRQASGRDDPASRRLWELHVERMAEAAKAARAGRPDLRLSGRDPWALRLCAVVAFVAAAFFAGTDPARTLDAALRPAAGEAVAAGPAFEGWASPPDYTGLPVVYLGETPDEPGLTLPAGSTVLLRVYGAGEQTTLNETLSGNSAALTETAGGIRAAEFTVTRSGEISLVDGGSTLGRWRFEVIADAPPEVAPTSPVERAVTGATQLEFSASDDYGVAAAWAEIELDLASVDRRHGLAAAPVPRETIAVDLPLPISGGTQEVAETMLEDFSKHVWAGLPVTLTLFAADDAQQTASSRIAVAQLPGRVFYDPLAAAIVEQRRDLLWSPENLRRVIQVLKAITNRPEDIFTSDPGYLVTRVALRRLQYASEDGVTTAETEDVAELLWHAALLIEEGNLNDAAEQLRRAQERLSKALENGASDEEIAQLMDELRQAMQNFLDEMARQALQNGEMQQSQLPDGQQLSQDQLQQLMDQIQQLSEQGRREEARRLLEELRRLMENMRMTLQQGQRGQGGQQGQQLLEDLQDTLRQQQDLADEAFRELQRRFQEGRRGQDRQQGQQGRPGQQGQRGQEGRPQGRGDQENQGGVSPGDLARRQEALRQLLEDLRGRLPGGQTGQGDGGRLAREDADRDMGAARDGLDQGALGGALDDQAAAIDDLRQGLEQLAQELQRAQQRLGNNERNGQGLNRQARDPLGRPSGSTGGIRTDESLLPDADALRRAQEILDEIRRRSGERTRPRLELDYLRRLLDRF
ncbi:MAG: TIGR02302 family protein [Paracoccaceae bacterium]